MSTDPSPNNNHHHSVTPTEILDYYQSQSPSPFQTEFELENQDHQQNPNPNPSTYTAIHTPISPKWPSSPSPSSTSSPRTHLFSFPAPIRSYTNNSLLTSSSSNFTSNSTSPSAFTSTSTPLATGLSRHYAYAPSHLNQSTQNSNTVYSVPVPRFLKTQTRQDTRWQGVWLRKGTVRVKFGELIREEKGRKRGDKVMEIVEENEREYANGEEDREDRDGRDGDVESLAASTDEKQDRVGRKSKGKGKGRKKGWF